MSYGNVLCYKLCCKPRHNIPTFCATTHRHALYLYSGPLFMPRRPPSTGVTQACATWAVTPPEFFTPSSGCWPPRREPDIMVLFRSDPVAVQGNITFSAPQEVSVVSAGFLRVTSRRVTTMFFDTKSADIGEVLPVGYQVTSLLWELLWLSVGQDSHLPIQPVLHVIRIHDSSIPLRRLDTYTPAAFSRLTGFMGSIATFRISPNPFVCQNMFQMSQDFKSPFVFF